MPAPTPLESDRADASPVDSRRYGRSAKIPEAGRDAERLYLAGNLRRFMPSFLCTINNGEKLLTVVYGSTCFVVDGLFLFLGLSGHG